MLKTLTLGQILSLLDYAKVYEARRPILEKQLKQF